VFPAECGGGSPHFFILFSARTTGTVNLPGYMNTDLESVVEREVDAIGYDVVLLRKGGTRSRPVLEVRIDRRDGKRVSIADCVRVSRAVEARLDAVLGDAAPFGGRRYELQVSSPGDARRRERGTHIGATPESPTLAEQSDVAGHGIDEQRPGGSARLSEGPRESSSDVHTDDGSRNGRFD
jgi:RimP N-terminal domain